MPQWHDLPPVIHHQILREFCKSLAFDFSKYQSVFNTDTEFAIAWHEPYPRPLVNYINALLTCRHFYRAITEEIKIAFDQSTSLTLQTIQYKKLIEYSDKLFEEGPGDYRELAVAQAMFGCFWKNPFVCNVYPIFDDIFGGLEKTGELLLVCLSGGVLEKCKELRVSNRHEDIRLQKALVDGSFCGLVFSKGSYYVGGDCICFYTVSSCEFAAFKDHDVEDVHGYDEEGGVERLPHPHQSMQSLPDISASEPDSWWLGHNIGGRDHWKEWYLVNYKEKKIVVGPTGQTAEWPEYFTLEELHLWTPEFLKDCYYDE
jgi:hypothetical protein